MATSAAFATPSFPARSDSAGQAADTVTLLAGYAAQQVDPHAAYGLVPS